MAYHTPLAWTPRPHPALNPPRWCTPKYTELPAQGQSKMCSLKWTPHTSPHPMGGQIRCCPGQGNFSEGTAFCYPFHTVLTSFILHPILAQACLAKTHPYFNTHWMVSHLGHGVASWDNSSLLVEHQEFKLLTISDPRRTNLRRQTEEQPTSHSLLDPSKQPPRPSIRSMYYITPLCPYMAVSWLKYFTGNPAVYFVEIKKKRWLCQTPPTCS